MIRDLQYPDDARKVLDALITGLEYDAAFAILGNSLKTLATPRGQPDFGTGIRFGGGKVDHTVRREAPGLCSRFSLISMVSRFESFTESLLLQRRVLEELKTEGVKMSGKKMWEILRSVQRDIRRLSPSQVTLQLLVENPSGELSARVDWLVGINRVRNCLAHRLGIVQMEDVRKPGQSIENVQANDTLRVRWLRIKPLVDGQEIKSFPYQGKGDGKGEMKVEVMFEEYEREWKIGDIIHITPGDCQNIATSLSLLGTRVLSEFENEMNSFLQKHNTTGTV